MAIARITPTIRVMVLGILLLMAACSSTEADSLVEFTGDITAINGTFITVGGLSVDISNATVLLDDLQIDVTVHITGNLEGQVVVATAIEIVANNPNPVPSQEVMEATAEVTESASETTPEPAPTAVGGNEVPIIVIEGPVQAINVNLITIFGINIQVDPADSILTEIRIGDTIRIEGASSFEGNTIIIVAINITIIESTIIIVNNPIYVAPGLPANCRVKRSGRITCRNTQRNH